MAPIVNDYIERLACLHADEETTNAGFPPDALDWVLAPEMNSMAVPVTRLAGADGYWTAQ